MRLPTKDSAVARALRTLVYVIIPSLIALLTDPEAVRLIVKYYPGVAGFIVAGAPTVALIYNIIRKDVKSY